MFDVVALQERLALAREKQLIEKSRDSMLCVNCATPVKDAVPQPAQSLTRQSMLHTTKYEHIDST